MIRHDRINAWDEQTTIGFIQWICLNWCEPDKAGLYYTSDSDGRVRKLYMSDPKEPICNMIFPLDDMADKPIWSNGNVLTNDEIIDVCNAESVWYNLEEVDSYGEYIGNRLVIIAEEDLPVYWADFGEIVGPTKYDIEHSPIHINKR